MRNYIFILIFLNIIAFGIDIKAQTAKPAVNKTTGISDNCSYFPVKNGLRFTYKRNNMFGELTITETYTAVKDKVLKSGKAIKGYKISSDDENRDNTVIYYYCDSGSIKMYTEMPEYDTHITGFVEDYSILPSDYNKPDYKKTAIWETEKYGSGKYLTFTELKEGAAGSQWTDIKVVNGNLSVIRGAIEETGLTMTVLGQTYSPVIHIKRTMSVEIFGKMQELNTQDVYYAKGIGKIKFIEKGQDLLIGSYTTTQELVSHNLPTQANNSKSGEKNDKKMFDNINTTEKTTAYKLDAIAIAMMCDKWCGSYKLIKKDGKPVGDFPYGEYLHLETEGDGIAMTLQKKNGKLYETGKETNIEWSVWMENNQKVIYIRTASETKGKPVNSNSVPRRTLVFDNKVYEYVSREIEYY